MKRKKKKITNSKCIGLGSPLDMLAALHILQFASNFLFSLPNEAFILYLIFTEVWFFPQILETSSKEK